MFTSSDNQPPCRILHIASGDLWAGAEAQVFQLLRTLNKCRSVQIRVVVMNPGILSERLLAEGIQVDTLDERQQGFASLTGSILKIGQDWHPSIIHTHRRKEHIIGAFSAFACNAQAIATIHGRAEFSHSGSNIRQYFLAALERFSLRQIHQRLIAVSHELADHLPVPREHIQVIPNAVDAEQVKANAAAYDLQLPELGGYRVAFLGRLVPVKRVDRIIEAISMLVESEPNSWSLFILGDGPLRLSLEKQVNSLGLDKHVTFAGFVENPLPWLARMDLLVFSSEHEGLPMTALESIALGVPIVSTNVGGLPDLIRASGFGTISKSDSTEALVDAIQKTVAKLETFRKSCDVVIPNRYTIEKCASAYVNLYSELAQSIAKHKETSGS